MFSLGKMAVTVKQMALVVAFTCVLSFIFGVVAENKKPAAGTPITGQGGALVLLYSSTEQSSFHNFHQSRTLRDTTGGKKMLILHPFVKWKMKEIFAILIRFMAGLAATLPLWPTITEQLLSGGAFVSLDSSLVWLVALMLADNASEDYFEEVEADPKGEYGQVITQRI